MKALQLLVLCLLLLPVETQAWGRTGHRVVGSIAQQHLSKKARKAVNRILGGESLAMASTWMDDIKSDRTYEALRDWHWVTIPDGSTYALAAKNPNGDAVETIDRMIAALQSDTLPPEREVVCLKVLVHLIGDLHQPLHVGKGDDKGGNDFQVRWFKQGSNLHRVWDSGMIDESQLSYSELARSLDRATRAQITQWSQGSAADWAQENVAFRTAIYPEAPGAELGYAYQYQHWPLVQQQLLKGGIRLAGVLNAVFG
ncbi:MAG: S1/P1 nuclease [Flavobacteriales bacterium]|nr:S1/P1 nuclease [Flavobacteriales bacterium]MBP9079248.1 S1/P1 nuclease [Flavobacteriales bacterium]